MAASEKAEATVTAPVAASTTPAAVQSPTTPSSGFEIVTVRKADGTLVKVKKPITSSVDGSKSPVSAKPAAAPAGYKIVTVRKPDGTLVKVKRPITQDEKATTNTNTAASQVEPKVSGEPATPVQANTAAVTTTTPKPAAMTSKPVAASQPTAVPAAVSPTTSTAHNTKEAAQQATLTAMPEKSVAPVEVVSKSLEDAPPSAAEMASRTAQANVAAQIFKGITKFRGGAKIIGAFAPDYDVGDLEDGDIEFSDDDFDSDESDEDDDDDDNRSTNDHNDKDDEKHALNGKDDQPRSVGGNSGSGNNITATDAITTAVPALLPAVLPQAGPTSPAGTQPTRAVPSNAASPASAGQAPPAYSAAQNSTSPLSNKATPQAQATLTKRAKTDPVISEKEVKSDPDVEAKGKPQRAPRELEKKRYTDWTRYVIWTVMVALPILFIVLGIITASLKNTPTGSKTGNAVSQAIKIAVTAWPIIFAAIAAQSLRALATYKVERGIRLMTLEQLISSQSVASCVKQPFMLRRFNLVSIALIALWALSPLASSAMQRMLTTAPNVVQQDRTMYYLDTSSANFILQRNNTYDYNTTQFSSQNNYGLHDLSNGVALGDFIRQLYHSSMIAGGQFQSTYSDSWDNPLIPEMLYLPSDLEKDAEGYFIINEKVTQYASRFGIPFEKTALNQSGTYDFEIASSHLDFDLDFMNKTRLSVIDATGIKYAEHPDGTNFKMAMTPMTQNTPGKVYFAMSSVPPENLPSNDTNESPWYTYAIFTFKQKFVDTKINCNVGHFDEIEVLRSDCYVSGIRETANPPAVNLMGDFAQAFVLASENMLERWIYKPNDIQAIITSPDNLDLNTLDPETFKRRFSILFNSYWQLGYAPMYQTIGINHTQIAALFTNETILQNPDGTRETPVLQVRNSTAKFVQNTEVYSFDVGWLVALFICSVVLLVTGIASVIWDMQTIVPDILGFASSVARKSKYVDLPKVDTSMGGAERARLLGEVTVMMQDVKPKAGVGRIALGTKHAQAQKLMPGRPYK